MTTVVHENTAHTVPATPDAEGRLWLSEAELERITGWARQGPTLRRGADSLPAPDGAPFVRAGAVDLAGLWRHLEHPVATSDAGDVWVLGTRASERAAALHSLKAPDFTLPDLDGNPHALSDYRGRKVFLASWASW